MPQPLYYDDPRYLPPDGDGPDCEADAPDGIYLVCTRGHLHDGDHAAHNDEDLMLARWPR